MKIVEIALERLSKTLNKKIEIAPEWYIWGYTEAISDFLWDYTGIPLKQLQRDAYDDYARMINAQGQKMTVNTSIKNNKRREVKK
jgi:hypothetical protein